MVKVVPKVVCYMCTLVHNVEKHEAGQARAKEEVFLNTTSLPRPIVRWRSQGVYEAGAAWA